MSTMQDATYRKELGPLAMRSFFKLAERWQLSREQAMVLLGCTATSTYANWKNGKTDNIPRDTLERISHLIGIQLSLETLFPNNEETINDWIHRPNDHPWFDGDPALTHMLAGNVSDLFLVRQYVDSQRLHWS